MRAFYKRLFHMAAVSLAVGLLIGCAREEPPAEIVINQSLTPYHIVAKGETLSIIASKYGMEKMTLIKMNRLKPPYKIFVGQKLIITPRADTSGAGKPSIKSVTSVADTGEVTVAELPAEEKDSTAGGLPTMGSGVAGSPTSVVSAASTTGPLGMVDTAEMIATSPVSGATSEAVIESPQKAIASNSSGQLRWPVQGQVIEGFGVDQKGQRNDGINIAVPEGTAVGAVNNGVVAHVGNQARGFGNLILVKHPDGKISVYGHLKDTAVKVGDKVTAGQKIGSAGTSGGVSQSQVHFELRQGKTPLNPTEYLK